jgi:mannose/fructose/N-acetylgalactosamine-specific phosphotransferase system component IIC
MMDIFLAGKVSLLAGLILLDGTALMQVMISQPLVSCTIIGLAAGEPAAGINMGMAFQLLFLSDLPIGSYIPKDAPTISVSALAAVLVFGGPGGSADFGFMALAAVLAVAANPFFAWTSNLARRTNNHLTGAVRSLFSGGHYRRGLMVAQAGLVVFFLKGFLDVFLFVLVAGPVLPWAGAQLPREIMAAFRWSFALFPLVGAACFLSRFKTAGRGSESRAPLGNHAGGGPS